MAPTGPFPLLLAALASKEAESKVGPTVAKRIPSSIEGTRNRIDGTAFKALFLIF